MTTEARRPAARWPRRVYRDTERGVVMGVCAGFAEFFDWQLIVVRLVTLLFLVTFTIPTLLVYFIAGLLLKRKPLSYFGPDDDWYFRERDFWKRRARRHHRHRG